MLIPKEAIKKLDIQGLEGCIIDCMTRAAYGCGTEYKQEQIQNALSAAREFKARLLGVIAEYLETKEEHDTQLQRILLIGFGFTSDMLNLLTDDEISFIANRVDKEVEAIRQNGKYHEEKSDA